jgi:hypothetical protein
LLCEATVEPTAAYQVSTLSHLRKRFPMRKYVGVPADKFVAGQRHRCQLGRLSLHRSLVNT